MQSYMSIPRASCYEGIRVQTYDPDGQLAKLEREAAQFRAEERQRFSEIYNAPERIRARQKQHRRFTERAVAAYGRHQENRSRVVPGWRPTVRVRAHRRWVRRLAFAGGSDDGDGDDGSDGDSDLPASSFSHFRFPQIIFPQKWNNSSFVPLGVGSLCAVGGRFTC
jgi:hypothetical protein